MRSNEQIGRDIESPIFGDDHPTFDPDDSQHDSDMNDDFGRTLPEDQQIDIYEDEEDGDELGDYELGLEEPRLDQPALEEEGLYADEE